MTCRCSCCEKTGACCTDGGCSQQTCADCNDLGGVFQGVDTDCTGVGEDECPCDPPADPTLCEKCVDGEAESFCPESKPNCCDGVCQEEPCLTGACCVDGVCSVTTAAECATAGGIWQGAYTTCDDGDCADTCCVTAVNNDGCDITVCEPGHFSCNAPCYDPDAPNPSMAGLPSCQDGTVLPNTVTVSGVTFNTGDPALDSLLSDAMNTSYAITRDDCAGNNTAAGGTQINFPLANGYVATVFFPNITTRFAGINITNPNIIPPLAAGMTRSEGFRSSITSACGNSLYDCDEGVSGAPTNAGGYGDYTNADITTS